MTDLGTLAGNSGARAINRSGVIAGVADSGGTSHAVIWQPGTGSSYTLSDLNTLIPSGTGWTLTGADAVNDSGQIVVETAQGHALLLTPRWR